MKTIVECLDVIGASRHDVENWLSRGLPLTTAFEEVRRGSARRFSRENVIELALVAAYSRAGAPLIVVPAMAAATIRSVAAGSKVREFNAFAAGNFTGGRSADTIGELNLDLLPQPSDRDAPVYVIVQVGEVVRRVDRLFAADMVS